MYTGTEAHHEKHCTCMQSVNEGDWCESVLCFHSVHTLCNLCEELFLSIYHLKFLSYMYRCMYFLVYYTCKYSVHVHVQTVHAFNSIHI